VIADELMEEARKLKNKLLTFKVDFERPMIMWMRLLRRCYAEDEISDALDKMDQGVSYK